MNRISNIPRWTTKRLAAVWALFLICLSLGAGAFAAVGTEPVYEVVQSQYTATTLEIGDVDPTRAPATSSAATASGPGASGVGLFAADDCLQGPDASDTVFGRYFSCDIVPDELGEVKPHESSPPISCRDYKSDENSDACFWKYADAPNQLLPAWRWRDHIGLYSNTTGLSGVVNTMFSFLASVLFAIASFAWWVLLEISEWVLTDDLVQRAATQMNQGFATVADLLNASGIFFLLAGLGLVVLVRQLLRGRLVRVIGMVLAFVIPIATIQGLAGRASTPAVESEVPTASPAWLAVTGVNVIDGFTSWFTSGFGRLATLSGSLDVQRAAAMDPSCAPYVAALYDQYYAYSSTPVREYRNAAVEAQKTALEEFTNTDEAKDLFATDPMMFQWVYAQVAPNLLEDARLDALGKLDQNAWKESLDKRSTAEKLQDARYYKVATVSQLWQRAFLGTWSAAQFGDQERAARMYCHLLESNADINPFERQAIANVANRYAYTIHQGQSIKGQGYTNVAAGAFERGESKDEREQRLYAWAACYRDPTLTGPDDKGGWKVDPAWRALSGEKITDEVCHNFFEQQQAIVDELRNTVADVVDDAISETGKCDWVSVTCSGAKLFNGILGGIPGAGSWLKNNLTTTAIAGKIGNAVGGWLESDTVDRNGAIKPLDFEDDEAVFTAISKASGAKCEYDDATACADLAASTFINAKDAGKTVLAVKGYNPTQRLALAVLGLFTSLIYVYAIGFLALGSFLAKFGLIFLIMLLPISLLLLAIPSTRNERNQTGMKMLRLTAGFIISHGLLSFVLGLILSVILLLEALIGGTGGSVINAAIPLAALFVVRKLLQSAGLGNLTSMQGALGMPLAAATMAAGKDWQNSAMGKFNDVTGGKKWDPKTGQYKNKGLSAADAFAKRVGKRAALAVPGAGAWALKKGGKHVSDRLALPERKAQLLGRRDANGNLTELGLAQRMKSLAGLMDMAKDSRVLGGATRKFLNTAAGKKFDSFAKSNRFTRAVGNADRAKAQMEWRRVAIANVTKGNQEERAAARAKLAGQIAEDLVAMKFALRDDQGNVIRDPDTGRAVFGYRYAEAQRSRLGERITDHAGRSVYAFEDTATGRHLTSDELADRYKNRKPGERLGLAPQTRPDGTTITGKDGKAVYGWAIDDGTGVCVYEFDEFKQLSKEQQQSAVKLYESHGLKPGVRYIYDHDAGASIIDQKAYLKLSDAERGAARREGRLSAVTNLNDGRRFFSDDELIEHARHFDEHYGLRAGQAVFSAVGFDGIIAPVLADADGRNRLVVTKYQESSAELARYYRIQYLANHQKQRPQGMTDDAWSAYLHMAEHYLGGYDANGNKTDVLLDEIGLVADSTHGAQQIQLALSGKPSSLDKIHYEIPAEVHQSMLKAAVEYSPRGSMRDIYVDIAAERTARLTEAQMQLEVEQATIAESAVRLEASQVQMRTVAPKLKAVRAKIAEHTTNPARLQQVAERDTVHDEISELLVEIADTETALQTAKNSASASERAKIDAITDRLKGLRATHVDRTDALAALEDAIAKSERQRQQMVDEEREFVRQLEDVARVVADESVQVFTASKRAEELGAQLEFAFKAMRRDKGKEDWSRVDEAIDDWIKAHNGKWAADGRDVRALESAFRETIDAGDEVPMRKALDELAHVLNRIGRAGSRAAGEGAAKHGQIINDLATLEGNMRHIVETNPSVIPWSGRRFDT